MPTIKKQKLDDYSNSSNIIITTTSSQNDNCNNLIVFNNNSSSSTTNSNNNNSNVNLSLGNNKEKKAAVAVKRQQLNNNNNNKKPAKVPKVVKTEETKRKRRTKSIKLKDSIDATYTKQQQQQHQQQHKSSNINKNNLITPVSKSLFESIEYLSLTWSNLFKQDINTVEKSSKFELLRKFHCADCLKAFQSKMNNQSSSNQNQYNNAVASNNNNNTIYTFIQQELEEVEREAQEQQEGVQQCISQDSLQLNLPKNKQSLSLKLAQRRPKKELVEQGILPSSKIPPMHYDQLKNLQKAQLQDYLKTKIEQRPKRELLVQKNILSDSKVSPLLQEHERKLKKARLAVDLNDKLLNRPGPLELVEYGILVSDTSLTEAIKDGIITYPKTTELRLKNRYFIDDQLAAENTDTNDENDSNSSNSLGMSTLSSKLSPSAAAPTTSLNNDSGSFADFLKSLPSPTEQKLLNSTDLAATNETGLSGATPTINTNSFLNNYQLPNNSQQSGGGGKIKLKSKKTSAKSNGGSKKVSQLIFHEYRGPNQKTSVSKTNIVPSTPPTASSNSNGYNFNDIDMNTGSIKANELSSYKIRLAQQKVFLYFDEKKPPNDTPVDVLLDDTIAPATPTASITNEFNEKIKLNSQVSSQSTNNSISTAVTNNGNVNQSIQILQIPDNLKTILNSQQIFSIVSAAASSSSSKTTSSSNTNCIAIQPSPAVIQQAQQQQYASILPLTAIQPAPVATDSKQNLTILLPTTTTAAATTTNSNNTTVQQLLSSAATTAATNGNGNTKTSSSIEEMTMNELKEECRRRKLPVSGNKHTLIERIRKSMGGNGTTALVQQLQIVKSPDSGVGNMEYSPSFASSILGDHSPRSVASISFNSGSRPPSVHNLNNNLTNALESVNNSKSHEDQINEERMKIQQKIEELNQKLLQLNYQQSTKNDDSSSNDKNFTMYIKTENTNDSLPTPQVTTNDSTTIISNGNTTNTVNSNNIFYTTTTTTHNVIKPINIQPIESTNNNSNSRQSTIKQQLSAKQKPIKILCSQMPTATTTTTTAPVINNDSKNNSNTKLRTINSMPTMKNNNNNNNINNLNGFTNLPKAISTKALDNNNTHPSQFLIHINIPIVKESSNNNSNNNFDNNIITTTATQKQLNEQNTNFLSNSNQQFINLIQVNNNNNNNQQQQQQQQEALPSISSLISFNTTTTSDFVLNNNNETTTTTTTSKLLPSIGTFSNNNNNNIKLKQQQQQEVINNTNGFNELLNYNNSSSHHHSNNNNTEMEWNDSFFTNEINSNSHSNHNNNNDILFNFDVTTVNDMHQQQPLVNEFLSTVAAATTVSSSSTVTPATTTTTTNDHLFSIDNGYFNEQSMNKDINVIDTINTEHQIFNNNLENIFNDNAFLTSLQDNNLNDLINSNSNNNSINNNYNLGDNRGAATFYLDPINFDLDFNQLSYLESPIV